MRTTAHLDRQDCRASVLPHDQVFTDCIRIHTDRFDRVEEVLGAATKFACPEAKFVVFNELDAVRVHWPGQEVVVCHGANYLGRVDDGLANQA